VVRNTIIFNTFFIFTIAMSEELSVDWIFADVLHYHTFEAFSFFARYTDTVIKVFTAFLPKT